MSVQFRNYNGREDYRLVDEFLIDHYQSGNTDGNWIEPAWEYMHFHPALDKSALGRIGIWEDAGKIVAVAHQESTLGEAFFQFHPKFRNLREELLDYADENLCGLSNQDGRRYLRVYVNKNDKELASLVKSRGYKKDLRGARPMAKFSISDPFPTIRLPEGFRLTSLAEQCDWSKVNRVIWRGFNHPGEPPANETDLEERRQMFDTPKGRRDLKIAVAAPDGNFVAFCGMFYEPTHKYAYVEPVATDPDYRRLGLGKAAVLEGIRRCGALGATEVYVGSDQEFYLALGFEVIHSSECWVKYFDDNPS
jgi:GNAT superfamily N-acetyltransferase